MSKGLKITIALVAAIVVVAALGAVVALAQGPTPPAQWVPGGMGGMWGGRGGGPGMMGRGPGAGLLNIDPETMHAAIAQALGMTVEDFEAAMAQGKTPYTLAQERGIDITTVQAAMQQVRVAAIDQALAEGRITQAQADWMRQIQPMMGGAWNGGQPGGPGGYGHMGGGWGNGGYHGNCPYALAPTPTPAP